MCQFGCQVRTHDILEMFRHFAESHTHDELKEWGIRKDLLTETGGESKKIVPKSTSGIPILKRSKKVKDESY